MEKIRAGIVGCGGIANNKRLPSIQETEEIEMAVFCNSEQYHAEKAAKAAKAIALVTRICLF